MSEQAERVFQQALALDAEERVAFVDDACRGQPQLRDEILLLLEDADAADRFFDRLDEVVFSSPSPSDEGLIPASPVLSELVEGDIVGHYRIEALIGRGGMGTVFRAHDTRLNREVALKFLPSHLSAEPDEQAKLLTEARAAAALDHPNVCSIYEVGETSDGRLFITMPCYDGETLKQKLRRGTLRVEESAAIAVQIARALAAAHSRGIIHGDVKPGNVIIVSDGTVRLVDFGLATVTSAKLIRSGVTPGTIAYMSPEQIRGSVPDPRTDLWSLGVVLYEMLTGFRPFRGSNRQETVHAILHEEPATVLELKPELPPFLAATVERLLQKDRAKRIASAAEVAAILEHVNPAGTRGREMFFTRHRGLAAGITVAILGVIGVATWRNLREANALQSQSMRAHPSVAILPMTNLGSDSTDGALASGITEDLIATLSSVGNVRVIASTSVDRLKHREMDVRQVADSLGVTSILEGGIRRQGDRIRLQVRLVDGRDGATRWSEFYDREFKDVLAIQEEIVRSVASELDLRFDKDRQFVSHHSPNIRAYELYLRGWDPVFFRSQSGIWKAQGYFQQAIAADSNYAAAHAGLAMSYVRRARLASDPGLPVPKLMEMADYEARRAIALDNTLAEAHFAHGRVREAMLDFAGADVSLRRAVALDPNRSIYRRSLAHLQAWVGRPQLELAQARLALETDPLNPYALNAFAEALFNNRRYDEAMVQLEGLTILKPPLQPVTSALAQCYAKKQMWDRAIATLRPGAETGDPLFKALLGYMLGRARQREEANRILVDALGRRERTGTGAFHVAIVHAGLGNLGETFEWLNRSVDDGSISSIIMGPTFDELHVDPRFKQVRTRLGLANR